MIPMKSLRSGNMGPGGSKVRRGREFDAVTPERAKELEDEGLAYRLENKMEQRPLNKMEPMPSNKAADAGPLDLVGGETGAEALAPSSRPARPPQRRRSTRSKGGASRS